MGATTWRLRGLLLLAFAVLSTGIEVEGVKGQHVHGEVDPDEYLWSALPGRCCFELKEDCPTPTAKRSTCKRRPPNSCRECSVWSTPENYCHGSHENCDSCGMKLYCPSPPPMLDGNKVCTGGSRVGYGCNDEMATGMCAQSTESDCEEACRAHPLCELFVYYPQEMKGTCVLCSDLISFERTIEQESRAYAVGASHAPPVPPGASKPVHFAVMPEPAPPLPPRLPVPAAPPPIQSHLGRHKADKSHAHVDCTFLDGVEFATTRQRGYTDRNAATKEECCNMCGHLETGCANFVYEPSSGACVLLPLTPLAELEKDDNEFVISGTASVGAVALGAASYNTDSCAFVPNSGYSSGSMGVAPRLPGGEMQTREECCQVCGVTPGCTRFTYSPGNKACIMYAAYAEMVMVNDLTSGSIPSKLAGASVPGTHGDDGHSAAAFSAEPPSPAMPEFAKLEQLPPPPPPDLTTHGDSNTLQDLISDISVVVFAVIAIGFLMCLYCFFAPQILSSLHQATNGKMGKVHVKAHRHLRLPGDEDEQWLRMKAHESTAIVPIDDPPRRKKRSARKPGRRASSLVDVDLKRKNGSARQARLVVQTTVITQSKDFDVSRCENAETLRTVFYEEFPSELAAVLPVHTQLFCLAPAPPPKDAVLPPGEQQKEEPLAWLLVTDHSDFARVIACPAFRLQDKRCDEALTAQYVVAFVGGPPNGQQTQPSQQVEQAPQDQEPPAKREKREKRDKREKRSGVVPIAESTRGRSRDRRGPRSTVSAPGGFGIPGAEDGDGDRSDDSATSRQSQLKGTGTTRGPDVAAAAAAAAIAAQQQAQLTAQFFGGLTTASLEQHQVSCQLPGCNSILPPAAPGAASAVGSHWDDEDPDGTGVSRNERVRAMAELE